MSERWPEKIIIGLTGNIATGKSAVMGIAAERGALALDADKIVHDILNNDPSMQAAIAVAFGEHLRRSDGTIDRAALGAIVFDDAQALRDLELLLHPAVRQELVRRIDDSAARIVVVEAIKLLEGELVELCDQIWVTRCSRELQEQRLIVCRGLDAETAAARIDAQNPQEAKVARADVVIDTDGTMAQTREQVQRAWLRLKSGPLQVEAAAPGRVSTTTSPAETPNPVRAKRPAAEDESSTPVNRPAASRANVLVRRARPSDIPTIMLLTQRATGGRIKRSRAEMLQSFGDRSYLLGQIGADVVAVLGWNTDSTTAVCVDQVYAHPAPALAVVGPSMLREIESSARALICEVVLAFLPQDGPAEFRELLQRAGYKQRAPEDMRRAWRQTVEERQPRGTVVMAKVMRDVRVI